jgi:hypothetical protein
MSHFEGHFEGAKTFLTPSRDNLGVKKVKKIRAQSFLNSGTLVILCTRVLLCTVVVCCCLLLGVLVCCCVLLRVRGVGRPPCSYFV